MTDSRSDGERILRQAIRPLAARLVWRRRWRWAIAAARWAVPGSAAVMLAARILPIDPAWLYAALCPLAAFVIAWVAATIAPVTTERVARDGDALGLNERLITAWELRSSTAPEALIQRQDALTKLQRLDVKASVRLGFDRRVLRLPAAALALAIVLGIWPSAMSGVIAQRRAEKAVIRREQTKIAEMRKELAATNRPLSEAEKQILAALKEAERKLAQAGSARKAVEQLARVEQSLDGLKQPEKATSAGLKQMASALGENEATKSVADALQKGDFQRAADALSQLAKSASSDASSAAAALERASRTPGIDAETAAALRAAAQAMAQAGQATQSQGSSSQAAQSALAQAQQSLSQAGQQLAAAGQSATDQASLASAANALAAARGSISASATAASGSLPGAMTATGGSQSGSGQSGSGSGQSGGNGGQSGNGSGTSAQQGQGSGSSGAGLGSTNQGQSGGQMPQGGQATGSGASGMKQGQYERIYDPTRLGGDGQTSTLPGQSGQGPSQYIDAPNVPTGADTLLPYDEVLATYSQEALESLDGSAIPPALQSLVKDYFLSLEPSK